MGTYKQDHARRGSSEFGFGVKSLQVFNKWRCEGGRRGPSSEDLAAGTFARVCPELGAASPTDLRLCAHSLWYTLRYYFRLCGCHPCSRKCINVGVHFVCVEAWRAYESSTGEPGRPPDSSCPIYTAFTMKWLAEHKLLACLYINRRINLCLSQRFRLLVFWCAHL